MSARGPTKAHLTDKARVGLEWVRGSPRRRSPRKPVTEKPVSEMARDSVVTWDNVGAVCGPSRTEP